jgi:hypothetical protein
VIDADGLALLARSFEAALEAGSDRSSADAALHELGWADLLAAAPRPGAAVAFALLGSTGSPATLLDDVLATALDLAASVDTCVVLPAPHSSRPPGEVVGGCARVRGLVSSRIETASRAIVPCAADGGVALLDVEPAALTATHVAALDPDGAYRRVDAELASTSLDHGAPWDGAVGDARLALAHQLIGASRRVLELARTHVVDREQFGRPVASFQAVRHKLAESLVAIEAAAAAAEVAVEQAEPLTTALAKSLAGRAARTTTTHAQQVLAGIGFTTEHPFHRYLKRVLVLDTLFGSTRTLTAEIGRALLARGGAPRLVEL